MSSSTTFTGSGFSLQSVATGAPGTVRVRFSSDPIQANPAAANDGLNITNYTITGPGLAIISSVSIVSGDPQSLDIHLTAPLSTGIWTLAASNIQTPTLASLGNPSSLQFTVSESGNATSLTAGAENDDTPDRVIRKHLSSAIKGPKTDAFIEGLSQGDDINWTNTQLGFNQIFKTTASGKYLDRIAANDGIRRRTALGLSDELFRKLLVIYGTEKITHNALRGILEVFYGKDALRAFVETELEEPYALVDGQTLSWTLDAKTNFQITFNPNQFVVISQAKAIEIASLLTKAMADVGSDGFAYVVKNATTGNNRVRIYSGSLGLKSFVQVTGGTSQPFLRFNLPRSTYSSSVTAGNGYSWQYTNPTPISTRLTLTTTGIPLVNLSTVEEGDYVVIGDDVGVVAPGTYSITTVGQSWSGPNFIQYFEIGQNLDFTGAALQLSEYTYQFFNPKKSNTQSGDRTVVVSQTTNGVLDIQLPATTQAVNRSNIDGAYLHGNGTNPITRYVRDEFGELTIVTDAAHGLSSGDWLTLDGFQPSPSLPFISPAISGASDGGYVSGYRGVPDAGIVSYDFSAGALLQDGKVFWSGGALKTGANYATPVNVSNILEITGTTLVIDGSEAEGSLRRTYEWTNADTLNTARAGHTVTVLNDGRVLATGGFDGTLGADYLLSCELYSPSLDTWTTVAPMVTPRYGHVQQKLSNGKILVAGGAINKGTATNTAEIYDASLDTWTTVAPMVTPRHKASSFVLPDGKVLVAGGYALGRANTIYPSSGVFWNLNETSGTTLADSGSNSFNLTMTNTPVLTTGKVSSARRFTGTSYATGASDSTIRTALLDGALVDFWIVEPFTAPASDKIIVAHKGAGETAADNTLFEVGVTTNGKIYWKFEGSGSTDYKEEATNCPYILDGRHHIAVRWTVDTGASETYVDVFVDGNLVDQWDPYFAKPTGGSTGAFWLCGDPEGANPWDNGFRGAIDEVHVAPNSGTNFALTVPSRYYKSDGWASDTLSSEHFNGEILNTTEIYDPVGNTWARGPNMRYGKAGGTAIALDNNRWVVYGGVEFDPSKQIPGSAISTGLPTWLKFFPNQGSKHSEIYDHNTGRWYQGPATLYRYFEPLVAEIVSNNQHAIASSSLTYGVFENEIDYTDANFPYPYQVDLVELTDWRKGCSTFAAHANTSHSNKNVKITDGLLSLAGGTNGSANTSYSVWSKHSDAVVGNGLNGLHKISSTPAGNVIVLDTPTRKYSSNYGAASGGGAGILDNGTYADYYNTVNATDFTRTSNVATLTVSSIIGFTVGDSVYVNTNNPSFTSGIKSITAVGVSSISYESIGANVATTTINGTISFNYNTVATYELQASAVDAIKGPIIFDPQGGLAVTSTETTTTTVLNKGSQINQLVLTSTANFPDGIGYLVFDFGGSKQSTPIKYLETLGNQTLLMDYQQVIPFNYPAGTKVTLLSQLGPYVPINEDIPGIFYATGSNIGRIAAEELIRAAAAAGISINIDIVYPGDRGLGAEGAPVEDADKLSDVVWVWGPDSFEGDS